MRQQKWHHHHCPNLPGPRRVRTERGTFSYCPTLPNPKRAWPWISKPVASCSPPTQIFVINSKILRFLISGCHNGYDCIDRLRLVLKWLYGRILSLFGNSGEEKDTCGAYTRIQLITRSRKSYSSQMEISPCTFLSSSCGWDNASKHLHDQFNSKDE